jgi:glucokinase
MYLAVDIGGSKTLLAAFSNDGRVVAERKFPTKSSYSRFLDDLAKELKANFSEYDFKYVCCAAPGRIDRKTGVAEDFGNLKWHHVPIKRDLRKLLGIPVLVENDANLAGLSEALLVHKKYNKVVYLTISTGIGSGIIINGVIDSNLANSEPGQMLLPHEGKLQKWEAFASGKALYEKYGKLASEINDPAIWEVFGRNVALGLYELIALVEPEVVIIGGGVGTHFDKYSNFVVDSLKKQPNPLVKIPPIIQAKKPEEAVIYGCFDLIKQTFKTA